MKTRKIFLECQIYNTSEDTGALGKRWENSFKEPYPSDLEMFYLNVFIWSEVRNVWSKPTQCLKFILKMTHPYIHFLSRFCRKKNYGEGVLSKGNLWNVVFMCGTVFVWLWCEVWPRFSLFCLVCVLIHLDNTLLVSIMPGASSLVSHVSHVSDPGSWSTIMGFTLTQTQHNAVK